MKQRRLSGRRNRSGDTPRVPLFVLLMFIVGSMLMGEATPRKVGQPPSPTPPQPVLYDLAPTQIIGVGGKIRLRGANLGTAQNAVVVFHPGVIAEVVERHTPNEIIVRVPIGAQTGPIQVVTSVNARALRTLQTQIGVIEGSETPAVQSEIAQMKTQQSFMLSFGRFSNPVQRIVVVPYLQPNPAIRPVIEEADGLKFIRNRLIVDLKDFLSFDVALQIADSIGAELVGHFPITNSYVLDLRRAPKNLKVLEALMAQVGRDPRVAEVWQDFLLELQQATTTFADVDVVDRYRHNYNANLNGREDVWATDRIQAPGAWNLIERFIGRANLNAVKVAVMDTGCDQTHPEFAGVDLRKVVPVTVKVRIAGREAILLAIAFTEQPYDLGDPPEIRDGDALHIQHGTMVTSLIGARNGNMVDAAQRDRGMNGLLHNPMPYTIQVYRFAADLVEPGDTDTTYYVTGWLAGINMAAVTGAKIMNASVGTHEPSSLPTPRALQVALRKVAHQLSQFRYKLLLVVAAGNDYDRVHPFEDLNLNNRLDAGEDLDGDGVLDFGNDMAASLGTLPNVIAVGAIGGPDHDSGPAQDWAHDDQRADFSNWGIPVTIAAPGTDVFAAGDYYIDYSNDGTRDRDYSFLIGSARFVRVPGTSFAAPLVTGSAALLKAIAPDLTPHQMKDYLINTAFEVNTTDGNGNLLVWQTLKTGFAVRQLMVDRGIIGNNQHWTGVSKIVLDGLEMFEIRRGARGRAEAFAFRAVGVDGSMPAIRHDGQRVAFHAHIWDGSAIQHFLKEYRFDTGATAILAGPFNDGAAVFHSLGPLEYSPGNNLIWGHTIDDIPPCSQRNELWVNGAGNGLIALHDWHNTCRFDDAGNPINWWERILCSEERQWREQCFRASWRPDNRKWDVTFYYEAGFGGTIADVCYSAWWRDNDYPVVNPPLPMPTCTGLEEFYVPCWSPEGRARAGMLLSLDGGRALVTRYYNGSRTQIRERSAPVPGYSEPWLCWSPDGSELACYAVINGVLGLYSFRRDFRDVSDRSPGMLTDEYYATPFSWQW